MMIMLLSAFFLLTTLFLILVFIFIGVVFFLLYIIIRYKTEIIITHREYSLKKKKI